MFSVLDKKSQSHYVDSFVAADQALFLQNWFHNNEKQLSSHAAALRGDEGSHWGRRVWWVEG